MSQDITIACDTKCLPDVRKFIEKILVQHKMDQIESHKVVLAVDEICANLIIHANNSDPSKKLNVCVKFSPKKVTFEITDKGKKFDITQYQEPHMDEIVSSRRKGGLGLILVRRIMDNIEFTTEKNRNICRLEKKL